MENIHKYSRKSWIIVKNFEIIDQTEGKEVYSKRIDYAFVVNEALTIQNSFTLKGIMRELQAGYNDRFTNHKYWEVSFKTYFADRDHLLLL